MEKIIQITSNGFKTDKGSYDGYVITTDKQDIKIGITDSSNCCEQWGYFASEDNLEDFIGSDLLKIEMVDSAINIQKLEEESKYLTVEECIFVNIYTSKGLLQLAVYNRHNGYYSHGVVIISEQLNESTRL